MRNEYNYLTIFLVLGFVIGVCIGIFLWMFLQFNAGFSIGISAGFGMLLGIVIGSVIDYENTVLFKMNCPLSSRQGAVQKKNMRYFLFAILRKDKLCRY